VNSVAYNAASQPTAVTFGSTSGSGDTDVYQYDPNTGRLVNFWTKVGAGTLAQQLSEGLTWNANGSLQQLSIGGRNGNRLNAESFGRGGASTMTVHAETKAMVQHTGSEGLMASPAAASRVQMDICHHRKRAAADPSPSLRSGSG
jgi:hypothetical protein